jgi:hypothetical protein
VLFACAHQQLVRAWSAMTACLPVFAEGSLGNMQATFPGSLSCACYSYK